MIGRARRDACAALLLSDEMSHRVFRRRARNLEILLALMPERFTLSALLAAYEAVIGAAVEKRNFRKMALTSGVVRETGEIARGAHRPARLFARG